MRASSVAWRLLSAAPAARPAGRMARPSVEAAKGGSALVKRPRERAQRGDEVIAPKHEVVPSKLGRERAREPLVKPRPETQADVAEAAARVERRKSGALVFPPDPPARLVDAALRQLEDASMSAGALNRSYSSLFHALLKSPSKTYLLERVFDNFLEEGTPRATHFTAIITALCRRRSFSRAYEIFDKMRVRGVRRDRVTYNALLHFAPDKRTCEHVFRLMRDERIRPDAFTYSALLRHATSAREARKIFDDFLMQGNVPNDIVLSELVQALGRAGAAKDAWEVLEGLPAIGMRASNIVYDSLILAMGFARDEAGAQRAFARIGEVGLQPNASNYASLMKALVRCGKPEAAVEVFAKCEAARIEPDRLLFQHLFDAMGRSDATPMSEQMRRYKEGLDRGFYPPFTRGAQLDLRFFTPYGSLVPLRCAFELMQDQAKEKTLYKLLPPRGITIVIGSSPAATVASEPLFDTEPDPAAAAAAAAPAASAAASGAAAQRPRLGGVVGLKAAPPAGAKAVSAREEEEEEEEEEDDVLVEDMEGEDALEVDDEADLDDEEGFGDEEDEEGEAKGQEPRWQHSARRRPRPKDTRVPVTETWGRKAQVEDTSVFNTVEKERIVVHALQRLKKPFAFYQKPERPGAIFITRADLTRFLVFRGRLNFGSLLQAPPPPPPPLTAPAAAAGPATAAATRPRGPRPLPGLQPDKTNWLLDPKRTGVDPRAERAAAERRKRLGPFATVKLRVRGSVPTA